MAKLEPNSPGIENWLKLIRADGVGPVTFTKLIKRFGSPDSALGASVSELSKIDGIGFKTAEKIAATRDKLEIDKELELAEKLGVWLINLEDKRYPPVLQQTYDPPLAGSSPAGHASQVLKTQRFMKSKPTNESDNSQKFIEKRLSKQEDDPDLAVIVKAWSELSDQVRRILITIVRGSS